jgi:tetratricopeptide (TPR) repeat protein
MKKILISLLFILPFAAAHAQTSDVAGSDVKTADEKFKEENYEEALAFYLDLLADDARNMLYNYRIGVCYLNTNINKAKAIPYLELVTRQPGYEPDAMFLLGRAYHFAYRFDDALIAYNKFKAAGKGQPENLADVDREIQNCYSAQELMKFPVNVSFENLGSSINTPFPEYSPFVPADESFVVYNTKRSDNGNLRQNDGSYFSTLSISRVSEGGFLKSKNIGAPLSTPDGNVEVAGMSPNGDYMILYYDDAAGRGDLYLSEMDKSKGAYRRAIKLDESINSKDYEIAATITNDGNTIYFASDRPGGFGGMDLYVSKRLPNGKWGPAMNLGAEINTAYDEDYPSITADGKVLYFSSKGHTNMGGYDIFKATADAATEKWSGVVNLGYPINTPEDNSNFRISDNGRYGYMAARRDDGLGDLDIYRITFNDVQPNYSVMKGQLKFSDETKRPAYNEVFITVNEVKTGELVGTYVPNGNTGRYVIILAPGIYSLTVEAPGCEPKTESINVLDKSSYKPEIEKDLELKIQ